jgi:hypothetical protein
MMNPRDKLLKLQRKQRAEFEKLIVSDIRKLPDLSYIEIGARYGLTAGRVAQIAVKYGVRRDWAPMAEETEE